MLTIITISKTTTKLLELNDAMCIVTKNSKNVVLTKQINNFNTGKLIMLHHSTKKHYELDLKLGLHTVLLDTEAY